MFRIAYFTGSRSKCKYLRLACFQTIIRAYRLCGKANYNAF